MILYTKHNKSWAKYKKGGVMDKVIHSDFQGYSIQELLKARDALNILSDLGFMDMDDFPSMDITIVRIDDELKRREGDCNI